MKQAKKQPLTLKSLNDDVKHIRSMCNQLDWRSWREFDTRRERDNSIRGLTICIWALVAFDIIIVLVELMR